MAVTNLRAKLGLLDSHLEMSEVALRYLLREADSKGDGAREWVDGLAQSLKVGVHYYDLGLTLRNAHVNNVVQVHTEVESFCDEVIKEYQTINQVDDYKHYASGTGKDLDVLSRLVGYLKLREGNDLSRYPEYALLNYYRLVRNRVTHSLELRKAELCYNELHRHHAPHFARHYASLQAPNSPLAVSFDDFLLYTRATKYFANLVSDTCNLRLNVIGDYYARPGVFPKRMRAYSQKTSAIKSYARRLLRSTYCYALKPEEVDEVAAPLIVASKRRGPE